MKSLSGASELLTASTKGDLFTVRQLLSINNNKKNGLEDRDYNGWTALNLACREGNMAVVQELVKAGADVHKGNYYETTPLHTASSKGFTEIARVLLEHGAEWWAKNFDNDTPLHSATSAGHFLTVRLLLEHGANYQARNRYGFTPLHTACFWGRLVVVEDLLEAGACLFTKYTDSKTHKTPFDLANSNGQTVVVDYLLQKYEESVVEREGDLALHEILQEAAFMDRVLPVGTLSLDHIMTLLSCAVQHPNAIHSRDFMGDYPIHVASRTGACIQVLRFLLRQDPDSIQATNGSGQLPIHVACESGATLQVIKFLVDHGGASTLEKRDKSGYLPLHLFCSSRKASTEVVEYLIRMYPGSPLEVKTVEGSLPFMVACEQSAPLDVISMLIKGNTELFTQIVAKA